VSDLRVRAVDLLDGSGPLDVRVHGGSVVEVGPDLPARPGEDVVDGGGTLLPGLHDHHVHLFASAARAGSVDLSAARSADEAIALLRAAPVVDGWVRAIGYRADDLDGAVLDAVDAAVRVQHRSGAQWVLNPRALGLVGAAGASEAGIERSPDGSPTGRLHRLDDWLRTRLPTTGPPELAPLLADLVRRGVTGVTDTTAYASDDELDGLARAVAAAPVRPTVVATGGPALAGRPVPSPLVAGPVKVIVDDGDYPSLDVLVEQVRSAHRADRPVAIHCVTRTALALCLAAWGEVGARSGDRLEHGAVLPPDAVEELARLGITVVTQPSFVTERGDDYLVEVDADDLPWLYRCRGLLEAGVPVAAGSDGPYASTDPWRSMAAAVTRTTRAGAVLGAEERIDPKRAIELHLGPLHDPGGEPRRVSVGADADLVLVAQPLRELLADPGSAEVHATWRAGHRLH
jgi:predicted amidohydrolase YtcJ